MSVGLGSGELELELTGIGIGRNCREMSSVVLVGAVELAGLSRLVMWIAL